MAISLVDRRKLDRLHMRIWHVDAATETDIVDYASQAVNVGFDDFMNGRGRYRNPQARRHNQVDRVGSRIAMAWMGP